MRTYGAVFKKFNDSAIKRDNIWSILSTTDNNLRCYMHLWSVFAMIVKEITEKFIVISWWFTFILWQVAGEVVPCSLCFLCHPSNKSSSLQSCFPSSPEQSVQIYSDIHSYHFQIFVRIKIILWQSVNTNIFGYIWIYSYSFVLKSIRMSHSWPVIWLYSLWWPFGPAWLRPSGTQAMWPT